MRWRPDVTGEDRRLHNKVLELPGRGNVHTRETLDGAVSARVEYSCVTSTDASGHKWRDLTQEKWKQERRQQNGLPMQ